MGLGKSGGWAPMNVETTAQSISERRISWKSWGMGAVCCLVIAATLILFATESIRVQNGRSGLFHGNRETCLDVNAEFTHVARFKVESGKNVYLVTGAAGFIGSHTTERLLRRGDKVVGVDEINDYYDVEIKKSNIKLLEGVAEEIEKPENFAFIKVDVCDEETVNQIFQDLKITHVIHLAARAGVRYSILHPQTYVHSNVRATVNLLEAAVQYKVKQFTYASSSSVYGGSKNEKFSEDDIVDRPVSQYAATKKSCELLAATYNHLYGLNVTGLRFFTVYGPRGRPDMAPFKFIDRIMNDVAIDRYGDGTTERDYTYVDDIVEGVIRATDKPLGNQVFNLGRGTPTKLSKFIETIEELTEKKAKINVLPMQMGDVPRTSANAEKSLKLLGYRAVIPLEEGLRRTVAWYKKWKAETEHIRLNTPNT